MIGKIICYYSRDAEGSGKRFSSPLNDDDKPDEHLFFQINIDRTFLSSYDSLMNIISSNHDSDSYKKNMLDNFNMTSHDDGHKTLRHWLADHDILDKILWNGQAIRK